MDEYFLDTSVAVDYIRGKTEITQFISKLKARLYINNIVLAELSEGIYRVENPRGMEKAVEDFVGGMDGLLPIDYNVSKMFGKIRARLRKKGNIIDDLDILIAATCIENNMAIITQNPKHFKKVEGLEVLTPDDFEI